MYVAGFDRRNPWDEPAFNPLGAVFARQIPGHCAKFHPLEICVRRRLVRLNRFRPARPQRIDNLEQQRSGGSPADKSRVWFTVEISNPNRDDVMVEDSDRPGVVKTVGRSSFPKYWGNVVRIDVTDLWARNVEHFEREESSFGCHDPTAAVGCWVCCLSTKRPQFSVVRERRIKPDQIFHLNFRSTQRQRQSV